MNAITPSAASLRLPRLVQLLTAVLGLAATRAVRVAAAWRRRRETLMLARADDRMLADLGLSRSDVVDAFSGPPWEDPSSLLRARALERRLGRYRATHGLPLELESLPSPPIQPQSLLGRRA